MCTSAFCLMMKDKDCTFRKMPIISSAVDKSAHSERQRRRNPSCRDGTLELGDARLGYTLYKPRGADAKSPRALVVYWHANAEVVTDVDHIAPEWVGLELSVLAIDYRGYGWCATPPAVLRHPP